MISLAPGTRRRTIDWTILTGLVALATGGLYAIAFPAALLIGPTLASTAFALRGTEIRANPWLHRMAQGIAGCLIAHYLSGDIFRSMIDWWFAVIPFLALTLAMAGVVGWGVGLIGRIPREESVWGFLPGMAGTMIALAAENRLDSRYVAFIQFTRLLLVILSMSLAAAVIEPGSGALPLAGEGAQAPVIVTLLIAGCGVAARQFLSFIPAVGTFVPMMLVGLLQGVFGLNAALPAWLLIAAYFIIGIEVGLRFTPAILRHVARSLPVICAGAIALILLCGASGLALAAIVGVDPFTGVLATVPGSIETVAFLAINGQADVSFVMAMQTIRLFAVVAFGPPMARWICRFAIARASRAPGE